MGQVTPTINSDGQITEVLIQNAGKNYLTPPNLVINSDNGFGAVLVPVVSNGQLIEVKVLSGGIGFEQGILSM